MAALHPAVAAVRGAVRGIAAPLRDQLVLIACSGGPDSLALAAAARFVLPRAGVRVGLVTVDHQLQSGSAQRARAVADWSVAEGFLPVRVETVVVGQAGGPEAAARQARYEALAAAARASGAAAVLLGHTRDDQAETVLLALLRGSGVRGLSGMPARRRRHGVLFLRPLLDVSREQTRAACDTLGLPVWHDPHNTDPAYRRTHARALLATLVEHLGPAVVPNLALTARLAAADNAVLDALARSGYARTVSTAAPVDHGRPPGPDGLSVLGLARLPTAVRTRVLRRWVHGLGVSGGSLSHRHIAALDALVTAWHGQGPVHLPGGHRVARVDGHLTVAPPPALTIMEFGE